MAINFSVCIFLGGGIGEYTNRAKGICENHDSDYNAASKPAGIRDWALHRGLGYRTCDHLSFDRCADLCTNTFEGCTHFSVADDCCFPFKFSSCQVSNNQPDWLNRYHHFAMPGNRLFCLYVIFSTRCPLVTPSPSL